MLSIVLSCHAGKNVGKCNKDCGHATHAVVNVGWGMAKGTSGKMEARALPQPFHARPSLPTAAATTAVQSAVLTVQPVPGYMCHCRTCAGARGEHLAWFIEPNVLVVPISRPSAEPII